MNCNNMKLLSFLMVLLLIQDVTAQSNKPRRFKYEEIGFEDMIHRYLHRDGQKASTIEGIYSVSCVITKSKRHWLTGKDVVKVMERRDNYARVAIMKETFSPKRDYIEVSMSGKDASKYFIVGELTELAEGSGFVYKHLEPDGEIISFSMLLTTPDLVEGQYTYSKRKHMVTTRLSYFKLYPKVEEEEFVSKGR